MGFPFEKKIINNKKEIVLCKLLFFMLLLISVYYLTTSQHCSKQYIDNLSSGALYTWENELEARCCATEQHLQVAYMLGWHLHMLILHN